ncbi:pectinesterase a [Diplodia corticola]|uniref:Pectinesterase n=1 Tax=Diplodia corticola TaxID=236234 RepID=A0A1J9S4C0_9PEZI|nr:pectinesterase a [Diplodia corticola]OJD35383.1 pectinesterase a [Diplodia corticola]
MRVRSIAAFLLALGIPVSSVPTPDLAKRTSRTTAPAGCLTVGSSATYKTITSALDALGTSSTTDACIFVSSGTYAEQLTITYAGSLTLYGSTTDTGTYKSNTVTITHTVKSADAGSLDASSTVNVKADGFNMYNINVVNDYGAGAQAVALTANADKLGFYGCQFKSYQDTLYAKKGTQYYSNCYIEGAVDYIFGAASAWFGECTIASSGGGAITASSRETADDASWYVIDSSTVTAASGVPGLEGEVYLGRPWRVLARVVFQNSKLSDVVNPEGWTTMAEGATPLYYEWSNEGDGASTAERLYESELDAAVSHETVLGSDYKSWTDSSY